MPNKFLKESSHSDFCIAISIQPNSSNQSQARLISVRQSSSRKQSFWPMSDTTNKLLLFKLHSSEGINIIQFPQGNQSFWLLNDTIYICSHHSMQILHVTMQRVMSSGSSPIERTNEWTNELNQHAFLVFKHHALKSCPQGLDIRLGWSISIPPFLGT